MNMMFPFSADRPLRIGTRRSPLAMAQAHMAALAIRSYHGLSENAIQLVPMLASGDMIQDRPLAEIGGKALWTKELERALLENEIDIAVHSMKDVETVRPDIFTIAAMLPRADVRDRIIGANSIAALPQSARVGTSSPRRTAQLLALRPDLQIAPIRGNVATRLGQIDAGNFDATLLAAAGLDRLSRPDIGTALAVGDILPAASQGAIGIDCRNDRPDILAMLKRVNHPPTFDCVMTERAFLAALGGTCHSPVAALATLKDAGILLRGEILSEDGRERHTGTTLVLAGNTDAPALLAAKLLSQSSPALRALFG